MLRQAQQVGSGARARYVADQPGSRLTVTLDDLVAIYHKPSGATHLLAEPAPQILEVLAEPGDAAEVVRRLAAAHDFDAADAEAVILERIGELEAVGLLWRV